MDLSFLLGVMAQTLSIYTVVLIVRVLLSWFPNLDWGNPVLSAVSSITDPYLNVFRGLIPPLGGLDLSSITFKGRGAIAAAPYGSTAIKGPGTSLESDQGHECRPSVRAH